ncbi:MAG: HlyD family efflux transporter periplasmic adaptor subunit [Alphaproteobacteria bacterium]|nr:HlyD family efflux transporter periplasmic adaptor subunit [Alphaproteobacteria bacterium]
MATEAGSILGDISQAGETPTAIPPLPPLREDVDIHPAARLADGSPSWVLQDRARNKFFRIGWVEFEILRRWRLRSVELIVEQITRETAAKISDQDVIAVREFLSMSGLLLLTGEQGKGAWRGALQALKRHWTTWLLHNYLFIRLHLLRPDTLLKALMPVARLLMTRAALNWTIIFALFGGIMVLRQWDAFISSAPEFVTGEGAVLYGAAIIFAKILHELGHGLVAAKHGLRVPSMGIALMVLWPVLYTDTSEAWKLTNRRARLEIGGAGMAAELMLAAFALNLWLLLPPGQIQGAVFALAAVTWIATLAVNLNPFMRFDGYYLLSDALGIENLQDRSFALARWRLRKTLFGFKEACPEVLPDRLRGFLIFYAWGTWLYRLILFIGIAVLVYYMVFKALGIFLMAAEIIFFIMLPIWREFRRWWERRTLFRLNFNLVITLLILGGLCVLAVVPWNTTIQAPALLLARHTQAVYPPFESRLTQLSVSVGDRVSAGMPVVSLSAPDLNFLTIQAERRIKTLQLQIQRERTQTELRERGGVLRERLAKSLAERDGHIRELSRLTIVSSVEGVVAEVGDGMIAGRWVGKDDRLAIIVADGPALIEAYLGAADLNRVLVGTKGKFYVEADTGDPSPVTVTAIDTTATHRFERLALSSEHGGDIEVRTGPAGDLSPDTPVYRMILKIDRADGAPKQVRRGWVILDGPATRLIDRAWQSVAAVLIRESGF